MQLTCVATSEVRGRIGNGTHKRAFDASSIDPLAIYCPSPRTLVHSLAGELPSSYVNLCLSKAKNGQVKRTRDAGLSYPWRMFGPAALGRELPSMIGKSCRCYARISSAHGAATLGRRRLGPRLLGVGS